EPELRTIVEVAPMADIQTMKELLQAPTERYGEAIVIPEINADHFEIKTNLLQLEMLRACPHHEFTKLAQIDTFYNGLNDNDQDSLNVTTGGNLLSKATREAFQIIKNKSKVRYSRNKPNVSRMNTTSRENASKTDDRIDKLANQILTLVDIFAKKVITPAPVKAVEESCVTCGGPHAHYNCNATNSNQSSVCAATGTYNQVAPQNRASNYMAPPGFSPVQNSQNRYNQGQGNNFNRGNNFHVVDFEADPQVPFILGKSFLRTDRALIDVYGEEITLRVNDEAVTFNLNQTTRYSSAYDDLSVNRIDIIDVGSDFILKEIEAYLKDESISLEIDHVDCDPKGDICLIEKLLNNEPFQLPLMDLKQGEVVKAKSLIEEPSELELKDLPSHLEYAYLEGEDKLPVIIAKDVKDNENEALLKVFKSHKRAIA
nr:reverse transcriptase domain-containing protein [Tanacetum cinerariifolium]